MPHLLSRAHWPPGGFQVLHPEIGMKAPFSGSFDEAVVFEFRFRKSNPELAAKLGLELSVGSCETYVDEYNAQRCIAGGWLNFVDSQSPPPEPSYVKKNPLASAAGMLKSAVSGWVELFGTGKPLPKEVGERRALVCAVCPQNDTEGGLLAYFTDEMAKKAMSAVAVLQVQDRTTSVDDKLGVCRACNCPMRAKVFVSLENIVQNMQAEAWPKLDPKCWIKAESGR